MRFPLFIVAAVVLIVFAIVASVTASGLCLGTTYATWFAASFLAFLADLLFGWGWDNRARLGQRGPGQAT